MEKHLAAIESEGLVPKGYRILRRGEVKGMRDSFASLGFGLIPATILVYLVMVVQLRSLIDPLVILIAIPLGLIGVLGILFLTGTSINIQSLMGVIIRNWPARWRIWRFRRRASPATKPSCPGGSRSGRAWKRRPRRPRTWSR